MDKPYDTIVWKPSTYTIDELKNMCDTNLFSNNDLRLMVEGGVDEEFITSLAGQHVMFVHQTVDQMRLLDR